MTKITEQDSLHRQLEQKSVEEITTLINQEDQKVALAIKDALPQLNRLINAIVNQLKAGGRLFYLGAGSGGRLSVLDAIELPTTFGINKDKVQVILAGGVNRLIEAPEEKEDETDAGWLELETRRVSSQDIVLGISASGTTPFVLGAMQYCKDKQIPCGCIVNNSDTPIAAITNYPVEVLTGPEFITGSTRMKCGSAQKFIFDMISTTTMIQLGRVKDNKMVHVSLVNNKITDRAVKILMQMGGIKDYEEAKALLLEKGSVQKVLDSLVDF